MEAALKCQQCEEYRNKFGDTIGDAGCFDGESTKFEMECPTGKICGVELSIDWLPLGGHQYFMRRHCAPKMNSKEEYVESEMSSLQFRDC